MKFFVTGSSGFLGSNFIKMLYTLDLNSRVIGLDINPGEYTDSTQGIKNAKKSGLLKNLIKKCDVVVHFASHLGVQNIVDNPNLPFKSFKNDKIVVDLAVKYNKKIVYFSTSEVYGDSKDYSESSDLIISSKLRSNYALEKLFMERYIQSKTNNYLIIRPFNVYGPGQNPNNGFIAKVLAAAFNPKELIKIRVDSESKHGTERCYCYVDDFNKILYKLIKQNVSGVFNIGNPMARANPLDIIKMINDFGYNIKYKFETIENENDYEIQRRVPSIVKLSEVVYTDFTNLKTGIKNILYYVDPPF
ncbi:hypothetical phage protein [Campylobacter phage CPt10]|uniref:UDP-glucose 4-epimerase n=2 Tax=Firehammervirus CPt10 TaxID=722418 RepID=A0A410T7K8_9CAUD|nr:nucleotide-sugar epimerase [Campylobacter phage CPt10]QAU04907.1 UDP-glucose 4-epimerase [Campylobacter phage CP20]CBJ94369.1 hypothetical phage protein [Campylobacter phage CPt10]